jgi:hypothetical protein
MVINKEEKARTRRTHERRRIVISRGGSGVRVTLSLSIARNSLSATANMAVHSCSFALIYDS